MTTLRDVAALAGVSAMTVSNVVNGRAGKVSAATVARVDAAIHQLGYVPNASARSLASASSRIIGLVYEAAPGRAALDAPYESLFVGACEEAARAAGFSLMLCGASSQEETVTQLRSWNVAGAVVMGTQRTPPDRFLEQAAIPAVFVDTYYPTDGIFSVNVDDAGGARRAGDEMGRAGHRQVAFVGPSADVNGVVRARLDGLREGLGPHGANVRREHVILTDVTFTDGQAAAERLVRRSDRVTAVLASGDVLAIGLLAGLRRQGVSVPGEMSVVGFDGLEMASYVDPPLTTVFQPVREKAAMAVRYLVNALDPDAGEPEQVVLPVRWVPGGTLGRAVAPTEENRNEDQ